MNDPENGLKGCRLFLKSMNNEVTRLTGKEPLEVLKSKDISINAPKYNRPVWFL